MNPTRHLTIIYFVLFVSAAALMGCATVNLGSSVPTTALAFASPDGLFTVNDCPERTSAKIDVTHSFLVSRLYYLDMALPPSIRQTAVVNAMFAELNYVSSHATRTAQALLGKQSQHALVGKPRTSLSTSDFYQFAQVISEHVLRRTPSTPTDSDEFADRFWDVTKAYYKTYFDGNFYTYFGDKLSKPTVSLTISDTDIVVRIVFLELILDEISGDPILLWQGPDGKIYPGGTQNRPSLVSIRNITTIPSIPSGPYGCGMNVHKANAVRYLANTFSKAAATET